MKCEVRGCEEHIVGNVVLAKDGITVKRLCSARVCPRHYDAITWEQASRILFAPTPRATDEEIAAVLEELSEQN
jgi:hypothetical protein